MSDKKIITKNQFNEIEEGDYTNVYFDELPDAPDCSTCPLVDMLEKKLGYRDKEIEQLKADPNAVAIWDTNKESHVKAERW